MLSTCSRLSKFDLDRTFAQIEEFARRATPTQLPVDISQTATSYIVRADLPGFTREQIGIEAHEGVLTITTSRGETQPESPAQPSLDQGGNATPQGAAPPPENSGEQPIRRERFNGTFARRLAFNEGFIEDQTTANLSDGVLTITLAKLPTSKPHRISVK
jgi:HSP20 family protein